jgi:phage-related protein
VGRVRQDLACALQVSSSLGGTGERWCDVHVFVNLLLMRTIRFYRTASGSSPVEEFLDSLSGKQAQKVVWVLRLVEELERVPDLYLKKLVGTDDLWEVRAQHGGDTFRLLGFFDGAQLVVLVSGFAKKTQKAPQREIARAEERKRDYLSRKGSQ